MAREISVGLIGYGLAGRVFHAPIITSVPQLRLAKVVERRSETARQRYPSVEIVRDAAALFDDPNIDLIVIATPNTSHFDLAREALNADKHVVVDKPFTPTSAQAQTLIELASQHERVLSVFQNRRWDGDFLTVRKIIDSGYLGQLVEYESHFDRFRNALRPEAWREQPEPGGGILYDLGSHLIDQALVLFGLPNTVTADIRILREGGQTDDHFELILDYERLKVTLKASMLAREVGPRFTLHGTQGSFVKYGLDPQEDALKEGRLPLEADWGSEPQTEWGLLNTDISGLHFSGKIETLRGRYQTYYENIYQAITERAELLIKPEEAWNTIRLIEIAIQSNAEKRALLFS